MMNWIYTYFFFGLVLVQQIMILIAFVSIWLILKQKKIDTKEFFAVRFQYFYSNKEKRKGEDKQLKKDGYLKNKFYFGNRVPFFPQINVNEESFFTYWQEKQKKQMVEDFKNLLNNNNWESVFNNKSIFFCSYKWSEKCFFTVDCLDKEEGKISGTLTNYLSSPKRLKVLS